MTDPDQSLERLTESTEPLEARINQYQANLRHLDDLLERAKSAGTGAEPGVQAQLQKARNDRNRLSERLDELKQMSPDDLSRELIGKAGPMGLWDAVATDLEKLVERVERK